MTPPPSPAPIKPRLFRGRPVKLELSSLILLHPMSALKMDERSMRGLLVEIGKESLYKGFERAKTQQRAISGTLKRGLQSLLASIPTSAFGELLLRAVNGDTHATASLDGIGPWAAFRAGFNAGHPSEVALISIDHCVEVEVASREADNCLSRGAYASAVRLVSSNPELANYFHEGALSALAAATDAAQALPARVAGVCEFLLAQVARVEVTLVMVNREPPTEGFCYLLDGDTEAKGNPGAAFVQWMKRRLGARTLESLLDLDLGPRRVLTLPPDFVSHNRSEGQAWFACWICQCCSNCIGLR